MKNLLFLIIMLASFPIYCQNGGTFIGDYDDNEKLEGGGKCGGTERWSIKVLADTDAAKVNYVPIPTFIDSLSDIPEVTLNNNPRIPGLEFQTYSLRCFITIKIFESDNDYHLVVSDHGTSDTINTMIVEAPDPVCSVASTSIKVNEFIAVRNWINAQIPNDGAVNIPKVYMEGVLFQDYMHGQTGVAPNAMELHPILYINFDSLAIINIHDMATPDLSVTVSPNSFSVSTNFRVKSSSIKLGKCSLEIYATDGSKVKELNLPVMDNKEINYTFYRDDLSAGTYIYRMLNNDKILHEGKLIIQ